ncbi:M15 family metallopeptidase [Aneurinibacillus terranovensis]|uniref:M15 family metallopeptidase n=1 Tax=Aneurinibacillus terranovensis TaxID=278991 RepID=UPI0003F4F7F2|nr:M15 family metallopeptidase [Aneurinibacillus terranovensis]
MKKNIYKVIVLTLTFMTTAYPIFAARTVPVNIGYGPIPAKIQNKIWGVSYTKDSPVKMNQLSYVRVRYIGFDNKEHRGELIVNKKLAKEVFDIFEELYQKKYPIEKAGLVDDYHGSDELSMGNNNSSAFNTRMIAGTRTLSRHSYGAAVDINPVQNPQITGTTIDPPLASSYANRRVIRKGMITKGDVCYNAFKKRGWIWGGEWKSTRDYMHFEKKVR